MSRYPSLLAPESHLQEANSLLHELHSLNYFPLSFAHAPMVAEATMKSCEKRIEEASSPLYREALEAKLTAYVMT
jgi:hypothetical protein